MTLKKWSIVICASNFFFRFSGQLTNYCNKMRSIFVIALLLFVTTTFAQDDAAAAAPAEERAHDIEPRILNPESTNPDFFHENECF